MVFGTFMLGIAGPCLADQCERETDQFGMTQCYSNALKATEQSLDELIGKYREKLNNKQLAMFDDEQAAWLKYRDSYCKCRSSSTEGGSVHGMMVAICRKDLTDERLTDIQRLTSPCNQGELNCVGAK